MKRINILSNKRFSLKKSDLTPGAVKTSHEKISLPKIPINKKWLFGCLGVFAVVIVFALVLAFLFVGRPLMALANDAKDLKDSTYQIRAGLENMNFAEMKSGIDNTKTELEEFKGKYEKNMVLLRRLPKVEPYYQDGLHLISVAEQSIELGELTLNIMEPYAEDIGFSTNGKSETVLTAEERIVKLLNLMPAFSSEVEEISQRMVKINEELAQIDASRYPRSLPSIVSRFGVNPDTDVRAQILAAQAVSHELADKAPQFEALFNAFPEFMGLNEPKRYMILMANNYEMRMSGGFNTYVIIVDIDQGIPDITYSIDTYFIDEGDRTSSSFLVNRNVPYFLAKYLYIQDRGGRLYARDATSTSPDFPSAANALLDGFWRKDRSLPQEIDGVIMVNNDVAVELLKVLGPVNTEKFSVLTDQKTYITIPITEFNADNVIIELENISGGALAETIGRKDIIKFLADSMFEKAYSSEATNLMSVVNVLLGSLSQKDVTLFSFDADVQTAFESLGYGGRLDAAPDPSWDYLHVNRSNFGAGKADWTKEGFVTQTVKKNVEVVDGKKVSTVEVTIHNPKRPDWFHIDPCCFYNAYMRVYVPAGSKLVSATASDGQEVNSAEYLDEDFNKTFFETFTRQLKETDLTITYVYELPDEIDLDNYNILVQRQSGTSDDPYIIAVDGVSEEILLNSDKKISL